MRTLLKHAVAIGLAILFASGGVALAESGDIAKVGTAGTLFLNIPIGARGVGIGNAFSAISNDETSMFWNPAGLVYATNSRVMVEHIQWLADINYSIVAGSHSFNDSWALGAFAASLNSGEIERTTVMQPEGTGQYFEVTDFLAGVSAATRLTDKFSFGANLKVVSEDLDGSVATNWVVDVGTMYDTKWKTVMLSMNIRNFGPEVQLGGGYYDYDNGQRSASQTDYLPYQYPMTFKMGLSAIPYNQGPHVLQIAADLEHPNDNLERINLGAEYGFNKMFYLRGGYTFNHDTLGLSAGVGAEWKGFGIDYAVSDYYILDYVHRFSVHFRF